MSGLTVVVHDTTETGFPFLSAWWRAGTAISGADVRIGAASWDEAYERLARITLPIELLSFWQHGNEGRPLIASKPIDLGKLRDAIGPMRPDAEVWFRACNVAQGEHGHAFMRDAVARLGCRVVAHCAVVAWPNPLRQPQICGLRPTDDGPWWSLSGDELPGCSTLRMRPPEWAYQARP